MQVLMNKRDEKAREAELKELLFQHRDHPIARAIVELMGMWNRVAVSSGFATAQNHEEFLVAQAQYNLAKKISGLFSDSPPNMAKRASFNIGGA